MVAGTEILTSHDSASRNLLNFAVLMIVCPYHTFWISYIGHSDGGTPRPHESGAGVGVRSLVWDLFPISRRRSYCKMLVRGVSDMALSTACLLRVRVFVLTMQFFCYRIYL